MTSTSNDRVILIDVFVASGIATVFIVRLFLALTGYPQIGGGTLHIAHMLWGGLLLAGVLVYLALVTVPNKLAAMALGGLGFGLFIDEIGKFLTKDNDYFFQPAAALIIAAFILIWIGTRYILAHRDHTTFLPILRWPQNTVVSTLVLLWTVAIAVLSLYGIASNLFLPPDVHTDERILTIGSYVIYVFVAATALVHLSRHRFERAAYYVRLGALYGFVITAPISFYIDQFGAAASFCISVAVFIAVTVPAYEKIHAS